MSTIEATRVKSARPPLTDMPTEGRKRVVIDAVRPEVDGGRFPAKRILGEPVRIEADIVVDGHDLLRAELLTRRKGETEPEVSPLTLTVNDIWIGEFKPVELGDHEFTVRAWVDRFGSWRRDTEKKATAGQDVAVEFKAGAELVQEAADTTKDKRARQELQSFAQALASGADQDERLRAALDHRLLDLMNEHAPRPLVTELGRWIPIRIDRKRAQFSTWYELFPRSAAGEEGKHGTFRDVERWLPRLQRLGFDVLYLPPIHPIGRVNRKGKNNAVRAEPGDVGSPWAIGSDEGGHMAIHPDLGTLEDFDRLVNEARKHDIEIALDIAFQCAPDHPYVKSHPEWFRKRPDGTIQYAENPPKKYEDIYPFDFETKEWQSLWTELKSVFEFWIEHGVRIFRVDNPHTKSLPFWDWTINALYEAHPDVLFLSEAFTRPKMMYRLAKLGFTQSYTYFAWRNAPWELEQYFTELSRPPVSDFFRPNAWPNTPDILTEHLQQGGRPASIARLILAATLSANYGIYGPPYEVTDVRPRHAGSEEYLDSEKYQLRTWNLDRPDGLHNLIARLNRIRRENESLQRNDTLRFHKGDNPALLCYSKTSPDGENIIVCVVNTNPHHTEMGHVDLDLGLFNVAWDHPYQMHDLLTDARYIWQGGRNFVSLDPGVVPAHVFRLRKRVRDEHDFETFM